MIKEVGILVLMIFLFSGISASCNETQIDINIANLTELDKITGIGPVYAQRIIDTRPFSSIDDLIRVSGIGNITLSKIKTEGLACVDEEMQNIKENNVSQEINETNEETNNTSTRTTTSNANTYNPPKKNKTEAIILTPIALNIKSEDNKEILKRNLALGGIITFCIGFGALFLLKFVRRKKENEFR